MDEVCGKGGGFDHSKTVKEKDGEYTCPVLWDMFINAAPHAFAVFGDGDDCAKDSEKFEIGPFGMNSFRDNVIGLAERCCSSGVSPCNEDIEKLNPCKNQKAFQPDDIAYSKGDGSDPKCSDMVSWLQNKIFPEAKTMKDAEAWCKKDEKRGDESPDSDPQTFQWYTAYIADKCCNGVTEAEGKGMSACGGHYEDHYEEHYEEGHYEEEHDGMPRCRDLKALYHKGDCCYEPHNHVNMQWMKEMMEHRRLAASTPVLTYERSQDLLKELHVARSSKQISKELFGASLLV